MVGQLHHRTDQRRRQQLAVDAVLGGSRDETLGQTFMEAAASGVPSVAFEAGGIGATSTGAGEGTAAAAPAMAQTAEAGASSGKGLAVIGGGLALAITYSIGHLVGVAIG